jgi:hypothetical protein
MKGVYEKAMVVADCFAAGGLQGTRQRTEKAERGRGEARGAIPANQLCGLHGMFNPKLRTEIINEVGRQALVTQITLDKGTPYLTFLQKRADERSAMTIMSRGFKWVLVQAFDYDLAAQKVRERYGFIPFGDYDEYLRSIGK